MVLAGAERTGNHVLLRIPIITLSLKARVDSMSTRTVIQGRLESPWHDTKHADTDQ